MRAKKIFSYEFRDAAVAAQLWPLGLDNGLVAGLREEVGRLSGQPAVAGRLDGLPAAVDVAVIRIVAEALANATRLARATECWGTVDPSAELSLRIPDGHAGTGKAPRHGVGLGSTPQRTADLGGSSTIAAGMSSAAVVSIRVPVSNQVPT